MQGAPDQVELVQKLLLVLESFDRELTDYVAKGWYLGKVSATHEGRTDIFGMVASEGDEFVFRRRSRGRTLRWLHVGTLCAAWRRVFFLSIVGRGCRRWRCQAHSLRKNIICRNITGWRCVNLQLDFRIRRLLYQIYTYCAFPDEVRMQRCQKFKSTFKNTLSYLAIMMKATTTLPSSTKYASIHAMRTLANMSANSDGRDTYATFLEVQMGKVTAACETAQRQGERMDMLEGQVTAMQERIAGLTQLVKLMQSYTDGQEQEGLKTRERMDRVEQRVGPDMEAMLRRIVPKVHF